MLKSEVMFKRLGRLFYRENSLREAGSVLIVTLALSNLLGVVRDHYLAQKIPTDRLDIYYAAFRLPDLLFNVIILGAVSVAFIPIFTSYWHSDTKAAWRLANSVLSVGLAMVIVGLIILFFLMPSLMALIVPSFAAAKQAETVTLARWLLISPLFFGLSFFVGAILNSFQRFFAAAMAPLVYNLSIITATILLADRLGVFGVAIGVICGAVLHFLIQVPAVLRIGYHPRIIFTGLDAGVRRVGRLMLPRAIGLFGNQVMLLAFTAIASAMPGAIAIFNLADNIQTVPIVVFGLSLSTAIFPTLSHISAQGQLPEFRQMLTKTLLAVAFFTLPATIIILTLRAQLVRLILGSGYFNWTDTVLTIETLTFFAVGIVAQSATPLIARAYYARHNTKLPTIISLLIMVISVTSAVFLARKMGVAGLALAATIGGWLNLIILGLFAAADKMVDLGVDFWLRLVKIVSASFFAGFAIQLTKKILESYLDLNVPVQLLIQAGVSFMAGAIVFVGLAWVMKLPEVQTHLFERFWKGFILKQTNGK